MTKDVGDRFSNALEIKFKRGSFTIRESVEEFDKLDFYKIRLTGRSNFTCLLDSLQGNANLTLYDRSGKEIGASEEDDDDAEGISRQLSAGLYFIRINRIEGNTTYRLRCNLSEDAGDSFKKSFKIRPGKDKFKGKFDFSDRIGEDDDDFDYYRFDLTERSQCQTVLRGLQGNAGIELFDSSRKRIAFSNKGGFSSERIQQILEAGTYFIKVKVKTEEVTTYKLNFSFTAVTINLGDNDITTAQPIIININPTPLGEFVGTDDPQDIYKINVTSPSSLNLKLDGLTADANVELLSSTGTVLTSSANTGTTAELISTNLLAGTYFARVFPAAANTSTPYKLEADLDPLQLFGLTDNNTLVAFNSNQLDKALSLPVTGLPTGETLRGIDFRPATDQLFGLSSASKLYTIDLATGVATAVSSTAITPALTGTAVGFDFNPAADRLRVVTDTDENLRLNPSTGAIAATDTVLTYAVGDVNATANPTVTAAAYTNNIAGTLITTLFGIDTTLNTLVRQGSIDGNPVSPNAGTLSTVGALGVDLPATAGFDIFTNSSLLSEAYAAAGSTLYSINLTTGAATTVGTITAGTTAINLIGLAATT